MSVQSDLAAPAGNLLSIVVPTFRREGLLPQLFASVARQVASVSGPVELVLVDNSPEASARETAASAPAFVRYVHEPRTGVAHARNRGVAEALGRHVIFLDDDEDPAPGWLAAFAAAAAGGTPAAFGAIEPRFETPPPDRLRQPLERIFSRRLSVPPGSDVRHLRAYLGSGNSMFSRETLALETPPFDPSFNAGGEDVWLFRRLVDRHGTRLTWCPEALVHEIVPAHRSSLQFLQKRRFSDGQLRCLVESNAGGLKAVGRVAFWMLAGAVQTVGFGAAALASRPVSASHSIRFLLAATGGAGKLLWWRRRLDRS